MEEEYDEQNTLVRGHFAQPGSLESRSAPEDGVPCVAAPPGAVGKGS